VPNWSIAITLFAFTASLSALLVRASIPICQQTGLVDHPGPRRVHRQPVPRGAGVAIFLAFAVGLAASYSLDVNRLPPETGRLLLLIVGSALITIIMLVDDAVGLSPLVKLLWQIGAALVVVAPRWRGDNYGIAIDSFNAPLAGQVELPVALAMGLALFWIVGMMNTMNWVDGLDGLAGSVTLVACTILFLHTYIWPRDNPQFTVSLLPVVLGGAAVGFLVYNWHPAKIIMGDSGANMLGFALGVASIIGGAKIATALLALGLPILDVAWVILYRVSKGRSPLVADRGHLHHRLLDAGWSQSRIVLLVSGVSLAAGMSALLLPNRGSKLAAMLLLGVTAVGFLYRLAVRSELQARQRSESQAGASAPG
jgi:UDP-N-acetylmuramyl pentapeptide phosphotransferase/UDP-N-acetylglucosamine-1-phosphate transferase